jgi:hypothetical protein
VRGEGEGIELITQSQTFHIIHFFNFVGWWSDDKFPFFPLPFPICQMNWTHQFIYFIFSSLIPPFWKKKRFLFGILKKVEGKMGSFWNATVTIRRQTLECFLRIRIEYYHAFRSRFKRCVASS